MAASPPRCAESVVRCNPLNIQIAAIALCLGNCTVVSKDGDLSAVPGLNVENWATP